MIASRDTKGRIVGKQKETLMCRFCGKSFLEYKSVKKSQNIYCNRECLYKGRPMNKGMSHHNWKADKVSYFGLHAWVYRNKGRPTRCESRDCNGSSNDYQWANKSREYKRDLSDWVSLCRSCHYYYDKVGEKRWKDHVLNRDKKCHCGREVMARELCSLHYNRLNMQERGLVPCA